MSSQPREESEWKTRKTRIDKRLDQAGWQIVPKGAVRPARFYQHHALEEYPTDNGPADYALCADGKVLGIVEAKKLSLGPQNVLVQAERYARGVSESPFNFRGLRVPFLYSTNGEVIWFHDIRHELNASRRVGTPLGTAVLTCEQVQVAPEDLQAVTSWIQHAGPEDTITVRMAAAENAPAYAEYPKWLPTPPEGDGQP